MPSENIFHTTSLIIISAYNIDEKFSGKIVIKTIPIMQPLFVVPDPPSERI